MASQALQGLPTGQWDCKPQAPPPPPTSPPFPRVVSGGEGAYWGSLVEDTGLQQGATPLSPFPQDFQPSRGLLRLVHVAMRRAQILVGNVGMGRGQDSLCLSFPSVVQQLCLRPWAGRGYPVGSLFVLGDLVSTHCILDTPSVGGWRCLPRVPSGSSVPTSRTSRSLSSPVPGLCPGSSRWRRMRAGSGQRTVHSGAGP